VAGWPIESSLAWRSRCSRLPPAAASDDVQAEAVDERITEHVDRVGEQGRRVSHQTRAELHEEHHRVDGEHDLQHTPLPGGNVGDLAAVVHRSILP